MEECLEKAWDRLAVAGAVSASAEVGGKGEFQYQEILHFLILGQGSSGDGRNRSRP